MQSVIKKSTGRKRRLGESLWQSMTEHKLTTALLLIAVLKGIVDLAIAVVALVQQSNP